MRSSLALCLMVCTALPAQRAPSPTDLTGHPFSIKKTWVIGGVGDWDYLTLDPVARRLFIAHGPAVQVVDVEAGTLVGTITGFREAHAIALDPEGSFGYVTDGPAGKVRVFDRRSLQVVASIPTGPLPRAIAFEPQTKLLFVVGAGPNLEQPARTQTGRAPSREAASRSVAGQNVKSTVAVIDVETKQQLAQILLSGSLGFAQADNDGKVYISITDRNQIARLDAQAIGSLVRARVEKTGTSQRSSSANGSDKPTVLDMSGNVNPPPSADVRPRNFSLGPGCQQPGSLAVDAAHQRLFVACNNGKLTVLNGGTGESIASLPIGPGADAVGYDSNRGLIFTANGGGDGSLTIIQQDVTDTYSVVQILPTRQQARTLAINSSTGEVYLVTVLYGAPLPRQPVSGAGTMKMNPVDSSFQVLVVGN